MTKDKKRLNDLSPEEVERFYDFVDLHKDKETIIDLIYEEFGIKYSPSSIRYVLRLCEKRAGDRRIAKDEQKMDEWRQKLNTKTLSNYAELLNDLFNGAIDKDEFNEKVKRISEV